MQMSSLNLKMTTPQIPPNPTLHQTTIHKTTTQQYTNVPLRRISVRSEVLFLHKWLLLYSTPDRMNCSLPTFCRKLEEVESLRDSSGDMQFEKVFHWCLPRFRKETHFELIAACMRNYMLHIISGAKATRLSIIQSDRQSTQDWSTPCGTLLWCSHLRHGQLENP